MLLAENNESKVPYLAANQRPFKAVNSMPPPLKLTGSTSVLNATALKIWGDETALWKFCPHCGVEIVRWDAIKVGDGGPLATLRDVR
jgi:hypothetical protein